VQLQPGITHLFDFLQKSADADNRPPTMKMMFDGVQLFAFSLDIVRPECSVEIDAALKATLIGVLPIMTAATMVIISILTAMWKSNILRQCVLKTVPDLKREMSVLWIFHHACLDAFFVQKSVFHKEMKYAQSFCTFSTAYH
jgi:hypothetical protein